MPKTPEERRESARAAVKQWRVMHPDRVKELHRLNRYGLTPEAYKNLLVDQENACAICKHSFDTTQARAHAPYIDHDHANSVVRGLLCHSCNTGIGHLRDSPEHLATAIAYLARSAAPPHSRFAYIFGLGFCIVFLVASNTQQIIGGHYIGAAIVGFAISFLWGLGVQRVHREGWRGAAVYATGAGLGTFSAMIVVPWLYAGKW